MNAKHIPLFFFAKNIIATLKKNHTMRLAVDLFEEAVGQFKEKTITTV